GLDVAKQQIAELIRVQREFLAEAGVTPSDHEPRPLFSPEVWQAVEAFAGPRLPEALVTRKAEREANLDALKHDLVAHLEQTWEPEFFVQHIAQVSPAFKELQKRAMRTRIIQDGTRLDGRKPDEIRQLTCEVGLIPRAHGSGLFQRGETQVLNVSTLGMLRMNQMI